MSGSFMRKGEKSTGKSSRTISCHNTARREGHQCEVLFRADGSQEVTQRRDVVVADSRLKQGCLAEAPRSLLLFLFFHPHLRNEDIFFY